MKEASKLAQIARINQNKQEKIQLIENNKIVFIGTRESAEKWMLENEGIYHMKKIKVSNSFQKKILFGSQQYVRFIKQKCKELALKGYGSVKITVDKTTDLYGIDEGRNSCYSAESVKQFLLEEEFKFDLYEKNYIDHYDAFTTLLIWDKNLPQAPDSEKIGMHWK